MKKLVAACMIAGLLSAGAHAQQVEKLEDMKKKDATGDYVVLTLDDEEITRSEVDKTWFSIFPAGEAPAIDTFDKSILENVLRGMVSEKLMMQEAEEKKVHEREDVVERLSSIRRQIVIQTMLDDRNENLRTEKHLKKVYEAKKKAQKGKEEMHARHILLAEEEAAKKLYEKLKKDSSTFEELAKKQSTDKGSAPQGGDLGWFTEERMVPEFSKAATLLGKGEISKPVKTDFGWHIIQMQDRRAITMPPFAQMRAALEQEEINKANEAYVESLLKDAEIEYFDAEGNAQEFPVTATGKKE